MASGMSETVNGPGPVSDEALLEDALGSHRIRIDIVLPFHHFTQFYEDDHVKSITMTAIFQSLQQFHMKNVCRIGADKCSELVPLLTTKLNGVNEEYLKLNEKHREKTEASIGSIIDNLCKLNRSSVEAKLSMNAIIGFEKTFQMAKDDTIFELTTVLNKLNLTSVLFREKQQAKLERKLEEEKVEMEKEHKARIGILGQPLSSSSVHNATLAICEGMPVLQPESMIVADTVPHDQSSQMTSGGGGVTTEMTSNDGYGGMSESESEPNPSVPMTSASSSTHDIPIPTPSVVSLNPGESGNGRKEPLPSSSSSSSSSASRNVKKWNTKFNEWKSKEANPSSSEMTSGGGGGVTTKMTRLTSNDNDNNDDGGMSESYSEPKPCVAMTSASSSTHDIPTPSLVSQNPGENENGTGRKEPFPSSSSSSSSSVSRNAEKGTQNSVSEKAKEPIPHSISIPPPQPSLRPRPHSKLNNPKTAGGNGIKDNDMISRLPRRNTLHLPSSSSTSSSSSGLVTVPREQSESNVKVENEDICEEDDEMGVNEDDGNVNEIGTDTSAAASSSSGPSTNAHHRESETESGPGTAPRQAMTIPSHIVVLGGSGPNPKYKCTVCKHIQKPFSSIRTIPYHKYCPEPYKDWPFVCQANQCEKRFRNRHNLYTHRKDENH